MNINNNGNHKCRIVLTGGPGAGKTTAADLFRREIGEEVVVVPEAATLLFGGGFPRAVTEEAKRFSQAAIYHVQQNLENVQAATYPHRVLLCDRGTVDSAAYWPHGAENFFNRINTSLEQELSRYDAVIFFETAAVGNIDIEGGNPVRNESIEEAIAVDKKLQEVWSKHPNYTFIPHDPSFMKKINRALKTIHEVIEKHLNSK